LGKFYRLTLSERGKFSLEEIKEADSGKKVSKIMNKRILNGKKTQLNLMDGRNVISEVKCRVNDSVVINFKKNAIEKVLPLEEKSRAFVFEGKYSGKQGKITSIDEKKKMAEIDDGKEKINVLIRQMMVLE
jgi:small subunit ribosomal protein S4e